MFHKYQSRYALLVIPLIANLIIIASGLTLIPTLAEAGRIPATALANDPSPPPEETKPDLPDETAPPALTQEEIEMQAALEALEVAQRQGPEAVLALLGTLRGKALDAAMPEIVAAHRQMARLAPPRPDTPPLSWAEEEAMLQAQDALEAASRAQALASSDELINNLNPGEEEKITPSNTSNVPSADLTVGSPPCTYSTIGAAMLAANPGDRLRLEGGVTFATNLLIQKDLTIQGGYSGCGSGSADLTTIDGGGVGRVLYIYENLNVTLENLNITNGNTTGNGAGIFVRWNTHVMGTDLEIYNNTSSALGGGVRLWGGTATFTNTNIYNNAAMSGAGVYGEFYSGYAPELNLPSSADIYQNQALTGDGFGGGVYLREGTLLVADCSDIYLNEAIQGGGTFLVTSTLTLQGTCSEIMLNTATGNGGGIRAQGSTINLDDGAEIYDNDAGTGGTGSGGGAYLDRSDLLGDRAIIYFNTADDYGGGVYATNGSLFDMDLGGYPCGGPHCSELSNNTATNAYGGGVYTASNSEVDLRQIFIENNIATLGGGVYALQSPVYLYNNLVAGNNASSSAGDGLRLSTGTALHGTNNTVAYNDAGGAATGRAIDLNGASLEVSNFIIWGHTSSINDSLQTVSCSDIQGGYSGADNLNLDPQFIDPASSNFHLQSSSPAVDRCAAGQARDFDNEIRPVTYVRPATPFDMGADETSPRVGLNGAACAYGRIQDAVDAASPGDTIMAAADDFFETVDISDQDLTIAGGYDVDCNNYIAGITVIDASDSTPNTVFDISNSVLWLRDLSITGGSDFIGGGIDLAGNSQVTLDHTEVSHNQADYGAGVYVDAGSVLTITNDSDIHDNTALLAGGGARVWGTLKGDDWASNISDNTAPNGGGVSLNSGRLEFHGSHILRNQATAADSCGGGIDAFNSEIVLTSSSNVSNNEAYDGAGICADNTSVQLFGVIHSNTATHYGGGLYLINGSTVSAVSTYVGYPANGWGGNTALIGAGMFVDASTVDFSGYIQNNTAIDSGGGIFANDSTLHLDNALVGGTGSNMPNQLGSNGHSGVGLYLTAATQASLDNTIIAGNIFQTSGYAYGGGAYIASSSALTLTNDSRIQEHTAPSLSDGRGAGLYVANGTVTLDNSQVISNTAGAVGGGLRLMGSSTLHIRNGATIENNAATSGEGGGIAAMDLADIHISDATLQKNTAGTQGGAIYIDGGTLGFSGGWTLQSNDAASSGGALAVLGSAVASFYANSYSLAYDNTAGDNGGMVYLGNTSTLRLYATSGSPLYLYANSAVNNGGALYADNGGYFDLYGNVKFDHNWALNGNGGAIYLSNSSTLWLDDYYDIRPELWDNRTYNGQGGAIFAADSPSVMLDGAILGGADEGNLASIGSGGAIYLSGSTLDAENCIFQDNQAGNHGGAIAAEASSTLYLDTYFGSFLQAPGETHAPQAPQASACNPLAAPCSAFIANIADSDANSSGYGGAIYLSDSTLELDATALHGNQALRGGALFQTGSSSSQINNSLLYANHVSTAFGAGIRSEGGTFDLSHVTIADNTGGAGFSQSIVVSSSITNSIAWGNESGGFLGILTSAACNIDQSNNAGSAAEPQFVSPGAGEDYHLLGSSPAIDACPTGLATDLEAINRPFGSNYDMGTYEYAAGISFSPNHSESGPPGSPVSYLHTLTNSGGGTDTFTLAALSSQGWSVTIDPSPTLTLSSGQSIEVTVTVSIPAGAAVDTVDTTGISATSGRDPSLTISVTDTTTVIQLEQNLYIPLIVR